MSSYLVGGLLVSKLRKIYSKKAHVYKISTARAIYFDCRSFGLVFKCHFLFPCLLIYKNGYHRVACFNIICLFHFLFAVPSWIDSVPQIMRPNELVLDPLWIKVTARVSLTAISSFYNVHACLSFSLK